MSRVGFLKRLFAVFVLPAVVLALVSFASAQEGKADTAAPSADPAPSADAAPATQEKTVPDVDPLKRPLTDKQKKQNSKSLKIELSKTYKKWLDEDVRWIITDEEQKAFKLLSNDEERDQFIEAFWQRRDPTPDTIENEFKEEHYRRMAYANEHFAAGIPGWKSDRGRIYICTDRRMRLSRILRAEAMSGRWTKAVGRLPPIRLKTGAIAIWKTSGRKSSSNLSIHACAAITT